MSDAASLVAKIEVNGAPLADQNRVRVKLDAINEVLLMEGLQKIANRITLGLVISAM